MAKKPTNGNAASHSMNLHFRLEKETPGAVRYREVDDQGRPVDRAAIKIGTIYIRKETFDGEKIPAEFSVAFTFAS